MGNKLKKIIEQYGLDALHYPDELAKAMRESGIGEKDIHCVMLILKCCPAAADVLKQEIVSDVEANALLESAVKQTGLSIAAARHTLGQLLNACGVKPAWETEFPWTVKIVDKDMKTEAFSEETVTALVEKLKSEGENADVISSLDKLARSGSAQAAYALGKYYRSVDQENGSEVGVEYFAMAAKLGYGPANGALAAYQLERDEKCPWKAAKYLYKPTAIAGSEGREWISVSKSLLKYRKENEERVHSTLIVQGIVLLLSLVLVALLGVGTGFWGGAAIGLQLVGLAWSLVCKFFKPYYSLQISSGLMMISWLILALAGF